MYEVIDKNFSEVKREMAGYRVIAFGIPVNGLVFSADFQKMNSFPDSLGHRYLMSMICWSVNDLRRLQLPLFLKRD